MHGAVRKRRGVVQNNTRGAQRQQRRHMKSVIAIKVPMFGSFGRAAKRLIVVSSLAGVAYVSIASWEQIVGRLIGVGTRRNIVASDLALDARPHPQNHTTIVTRTTFYGRPRGPRTRGIGVA